MKTFIETDMPAVHLRQGHVYETPLGILPSVTTVLGSTKPAADADGLRKWRDSVGEDVADYIMREAATIGTQAHALNECYLNGVAPGEARLLARAHHQNFLPFLERIDNIRGVEIPLYSRSMRVAGTSDCIAEYDGVLSIIDYKTKRSPQRAEWLLDYQMQAAAYSMMFQEHTGINVGQSVILVSSERDTAQEFLADTDAYKGGFLERLEQYNAKVR